MTISSQAPGFEARCKCGVGFIHTQLASSYANAPQQLASSPSTVGFIACDFHALISRQHLQTNRRGLYTLFLTSKSRCMQKNQPCRCPTYYKKRVVLVRSLRWRPYRIGNCSWLQQSHHYEQGIQTKWDVYIHGTETNTRTTQIPAPDKSCRCYNKPTSKWPHQGHEVPYLEPRTTENFQILWPDSDHWTHAPEMYSVTTKSRWIVHSWLTGNLPESIPEAFIVEFLI